MRYWLMKSEPGSYSIDNLAKDKKTGWDGVRNYQARNFLKSMKVGDRALFYHSSTSPSAVAGLMEVVREAYVDPTQFDPKNHHYDPDSPPDNPRWFQVDVQFMEKFQRFIPLEEIRGIPGLKDMVLLKRSRLSIQPVTLQEWEIILSLGKAAQWAKT